MKKKFPRSFVMHAAVNYLPVEGPMHVQVHGQRLHSTRCNNIGLRRLSWAKRQAQATSGLVTAAEQVTFRQGAAADVKGIQKMVLSER